MTQPDHPDQDTATTVVDGDHTDQGLTPAAGGDLPTQPSTVTVTHLDGSAIEQIIELVHQGDEPVVLEPGAIYLVRDAHGGCELHNLTGDVHLDYPRRKKGVIRVADVDSFAAYFAKHGDENSEIYADPNNFVVTAVLDAHGRGDDDSDGARWGGHRVIYTVPYSTAFATWLGSNTKAMTQAAFAEFIEDNRADIHLPDAATMLEIAQTFQGTTKVTWNSATRIKDGQRSLAYSEDTSAGAGRTGQVPIPDELVLRLPIFDRAAVADEVTARFRHRILNGGHLELLYKLDRPTEVVQKAFEHLIADVADKTGHPVLRGIPA